MSIEYENPWFRVIKEGPMHFIDEPDSNNGAVALVSVDKQIHLVEVFRAAQNEICFEAPRGYGEKGESSVECAIREVREETGLHFSIDDCEFLGTVMPNSALLTSRVDVYLLAADAKSASQSSDGEVCGTVTVPESQMSEWIADGRIRDGFTLSALALLWSRKST